MSYFKKLKTQLERLSLIVDKKTKKLVLFGVVIGLFSGLIEYCFIFSLQHYFQILGILKNVYSYPAWMPSKTLEALLLLIICGILRSSLEGMKIFYSRLSLQSFATHNRKKVVSLALDNVVNTSSGRLVSIFTDEITRGATAILNLSTMAINATIAICLFTMTFRLAPWEMALSVGLLLVLYLPTLILGKFTSHVGIGLSKKWEETSAILLNGIRNNFYLKVYGLVEEEKVKAERTLDEYLEIYKKGFKIISTKFALPSFLGLVVISLVSFYSSHKFGAERASQLVPFFYLFLRFTQVAAGLSAVISDVKINFYGIESISDWQNEVNSKKELMVTRAISSDFALADDFFEKIELTCQDLSYYYEDGQVLFRKLQFDLTKGKCLVIMGESGTGKSTLLSLLLGLFLPKQGAIQINGQDLYNIMHNKMTKLDFLKKVSYVGPFPYLIEGSLRDNLLYGHPNAASVCDDEIERALEISCINDVVSGLEKGVDTLVNEEATSLSTGQKQRLVLARSLLRKPKLLIMDECTSNLDEKVEHQLINNLKTELKEMATIIVTHRSSLLALGTSFLTLKGGGDTLMRHGDQ